MALIWQVLKHGEKYLPTHPVKTAILLYAGICFLAGSLAGMLLWKGMTLASIFQFRFAGMVDGRDFLITMGALAGLLGYVRAVFWMIRHVQYPE